MAFMFLITVPFAQVPGADKTNFPVLFSDSITTIPAEFWTNITDAGGLDIRFYSDEAKTVEFKRVITAYVASTTIQAWIQIPTLNGADGFTDFIFYCEVGVGTIANDKDVWDDLSAENIQHLEDNVLDDSSMANNGTLINAPAYATGRLGRALEFNGSNQYVVLDSNIDFDKDIIAETWIYLDSYVLEVAPPNDNFSTIFSRAYYCAGFRGRAQFMLGVDYLGQLQYRLQYSVNCSGGSVTHFWASTTIIPLSTWTHVAVKVLNYSSLVYANRTVDFYVNGVKTGITLNPEINLPLYPWADVAQTQIGSSYQGFGGVGQKWEFDGKIDELRLFKQNPSTVDDDWMQTNYNTQNDPDSFMVISSVIVIPFYVYSDRIAQDGFNAPVDSTWMATFGEWNVGAVPPIVIADPRYWVASSDTTWNDMTNWSYTSGGPGGAPLPTIDNMVIFDSGGQGGCDIDVPVSVKGFYVNGYVSTIDQSGFEILMDDSGGIFWSGLFSGSGDNIRVRGNLQIGGVCNFTSTDQTLSCDSTFIYTNTAFFNHNDGVVSLDSSGCMIDALGMSASILQLNADKARVSQSFTVEDLLVLKSGSARHLETDSTLSVKGDASCLSEYNQWNNFNNLSILLDGTSRQEIRNEIGCIVPTLYVNKYTTPQVVCDGGSPLRIKGDFWIYDGTFNMNNIDVQVGL